MERNRKLQIYCLFAASAVIGVFGAVCLFLGILGEYNDSMGYFNTNSLFAPVAYACIIAGAVLGAVGWYMFRGQSVADKALPFGFAALIASFVAAAAIIFTTVFEVLDYTKAVVSTVSGPVAFSWVLAVGAAASLIVNALSSKSGPVKPLVSLLSFVPVFYCASKVLLLYFDQTVAVNSPIKLISQLTYLVYMLVFTAEAGISLGKGELFSRYIFTLCCAASVGAVGSVSALAVTFGDIPCAALAGVDSILKVGLFVYVCARFAFVAKAELFPTPKKAKKGQVNEELPAAEAFEPEAEAVDLKAAAAEDPEPEDKE